MNPVRPSAQPARRWGLPSFRNGKDRGANLVEFAFVMPFLILLVMGVIEFAWVFATNLDVKHGAREGARITAVNEPAGGNSTLGAEICSRMGIAGTPPTTITWLGVDLDANSVIEVGDGVKVTVETNQLDTLTGILDWVFAGLSELDSTVEIRIEQTPDWTNGTYSCT
jgi:Flp pilus assembly protein TadG